MYDTMQDMVTAAHEIDNAQLSPEEREAAHTLVLAIPSLQGIMGTEGVELEGITTEMVINAVRRAFDTDVRRIRKTIDQ